MLKDKQAGAGLHKRAVPCRRAAVYNLTLPATKATPWLILAPGSLRFIKGLLKDAPFLSRIDGIFFRDLISHLLLALDVTASSDPTPIRLRDIL